MHTQQHEQTSTLTTQEVAEHLRVSKATVCRWFATGRLPGFRIGREWRIQRSELLRMFGEVPRSTLEDLAVHYAEYGHPLDRARGR